MESLVMVCRCIAITLLCMLGCARSGTEYHQPSPSASTSKPVNVGDAARGLAAIKRFECVRCHDGLLGVEPAAPEKQCVGCHRRIQSGNFDAPPQRLARWQRDLQHLIDVPSLTQSTVRLRASFIRRFLAAPDDLRPQLEDRMPILPLTPRDAEDIAALLGGPDEPRVVSQGDRTRGEQLFSSKGCSNCHAVGSARAPPTMELPVRLAPDAMLRGMRLAPDLGFASQRTTGRSLRAWLASPSSVKPDSAMPEIPLTPDELEDLASYVESLTPPKVLARPFVRRSLGHPVTYAEVEQRILRRGCWHCHSDPDFAYGDGGPGNTGGFGYRGQGIVLSHWEGLHGGAIDASGKRTSILLAPTGAPKLLRSLLARRQEEAGHRVDGTLGMPLGLPSLSDDDINLVADWLEQGAQLDAQKE
jgi:cytochrome c551/c552